MLKTKMSEYHIYYEMKARCNRISHARYKDYGGRGIKISASWENFDTFLSDMGERPGIGYSLDRIDNDGNYCKENCRWATSKQQSNNTRGNRLIEINGKIKTMKEWSREYKINYRTVSSRINLMGWDSVRAVTTPVTRY